MREQPSDEEENMRPSSPEAPRRRWSFHDPRMRDNTLVAAFALFYALLACIPLYNLVTDNGSRAQNLSILGGMLGLVIAGCAAMDIPVRWTLRLALGAIGIGLIVGFWGFGPM